jgi:hypothetical protein
MPMAPVDGCQDATAFLKALTECREISCSSHGYERMIESNEVGEMGINREMVIARLASAYTQYLESYLKEEQSAKNN